MKNILFLVIDALRYDIVADPKQRALLTPAIDEVVNRGQLSRVIANAATTQFVLPSLLSQSYPLDYGGYDAGIRHRPMSWIEVVRDAGHFTYLATSCNQYGLAHDFDRGFERVRGLYSASGQIRRLAYRKLTYQIQLWEEGEIDEDTLIRTIQEELGSLLRKLAKDAGNQPRLSFGWRRAERHNRWIGRRCLKELELLETRPRLVIDKLRNLTGLYYWVALGEEKPGPIRHWTRFVSVLLWQLERVCSRLGINIPKYAAYQFTVEEVMRGMSELISDRQRNWLAYIHVMDVHSFFFFRGFVDMARKLRHLPRLMSARRQGLTARPILHDLALIQVDRELGRILNTLKAQGTLDDTVIAVIGDHGKQIPSVDRRPAMDVHARTHREHVDTFLAIAGAKPFAEDKLQLLDSMSVSATILEGLGMTPHPSFKGVSAHHGGRSFVISENAGRGSADLERKDLYFTITTRDHKLMTVLRGDALENLAFFDLSQDPNETTDVKDEPDSRPVIEKLRASIMAERREIFQARGFSEPVQATAS